MPPSAAAAPPAPLRVLIVDDEEPARWRLRALVEDGPLPAVVVGEAGNGLQARVWLAEHDCDLLLLDIAMPGLDGLGLAQALRADGRRAPDIVFVTAHPDHALHAFELAATDYLTKPVRRERLQAALQRVAQRRAPVAGAGPAAPAGTAAPPAAAAAAAPAGVLVASDRGRVVRIPWAELRYLKAELKYVTVCTPTQRLLLDDSLAELEQRLGPGFLRIHRNALVARHAVRALERRTLVAAEGEAPAETWALRLDGVDEWLAVSRRQLPAVREALLAPEAGAPPGP
ncbi:two-component system regulatory protein [Piscinibacter sakaiensis]|uniref:Two-component system regulatory protein n=1 Tax=Piscinibacter sakaiensis TaxID=1547922 RepID=A0A0K8P433_PISS1|nr:two-component system regulatory protein [Piscinibacter sakaiensis]